MTCPLTLFHQITVTVTQGSNHLAVSPSQFFRRPTLRILMLHTHHQITQPTEYHPSNTLRAERLLDVFDRIVGLSKVRVRSRKVQLEQGPLSLGHARTDYGLDRRKWFLWRTV